MPLQKQIRRYLRRMRRLRYRKQRRMAAGLLCAAMVYLAFLRGVREALLAFSEEWTVEYTLPAAEDRERDTFRIEFRLRRGEILFFHERTEIHNTDP